MHGQRLKQMSYNHVLSLAAHTDEIQSTIFLSLKVFAVYLKWNKGHLKKINVSYLNCRIDIIYVYSLNKTTGYTI
jgi:hypothetical protein